MRIERRGGPRTGLACPPCPSPRRRGICRAATSACPTSSGRPSSTACRRRRGEGLLNLEEFADAAGAAYAAVTRAELDAVTRDLHLPVLLPPPTMPPPWARSAPAPAAAPATAPAPAGEPIDWVVADHGRRAPAGPLAGRPPHHCGRGDGRGRPRPAGRRARGRRHRDHGVGRHGRRRHHRARGDPVEFTGFMLMGGRTNRIKHVPPPPGTPVIRVKGYGMWGGIDGPVPAAPPTQRRRGRRQGGPPTCVDRVLHHAHAPRSARAAARPPPPAPPWRARLRSRRRRLPHHPRRRRPEAW